MDDFKYIVRKEDETKKVPIKDLLRREFKFSARLRSKVKRGGLVRLNGEKVAGWMSAREGDVLTVSIPEEKSNFPPEDIPLDILFEDDNLLVLNKQPGVVVHPTHGKKSGTIANGISKYLSDSKQSFKIRFVNRLDMDTSGVLVVAKDAYTQGHLSESMHRGEVQKNYLAVVEGVIGEERGLINEPIGRPSQEEIRRRVLAIEAGGSPSLTRYEVLARFPGDGDFIGRPGRSLVKLTLETGRTHQIRVHMSHIGHPVLGDELYGSCQTDEIKRQALHACFISFTHPLTGYYTEIEAPLPNDIAELLKNLKL